MAGWRERSTERSKLMLVLAIAPAAGAWLHTTGARAWHPRLTASRQAAVMADGGLGAAPELRAMLEASLRLDDGQRQAADVAGSAGTIEDLSLWTSRWTTLPGFTHRIHVTEPASIHMFTSLLKQEGPAHFGQLKLPNGTELDQADYMLLPSHRAPKVGVLMEALSAEPLADGSITVLARAVGRFRLAALTARAPFARANVALFPDEEELAEAHGMQQPTGLPRHWRAEAARAAASCASLTWWERESQLLAHSHARRASGLADAQHCGAEELAPFNLHLSIADTGLSACSAAERAATASLASRAREGAAAASPTGSDPDGADDDDAHRPDAGSRGGPVRHQTALDRLFESGAALEGFNRPSAADGGGDGSSGGSGGGGYKVVYRPRTLFSRERPFLLALEQSLWSELVMCLLLSRKLQSRQQQRADAADAADASARDGVNDAAATVGGGSESDGGVGGVVATGGEEEEPLPLPEAFMLLQPPAPAYGWPAGMPAPPAATEWLRRWGYPPVRRAQRLSYLMAALVPELDRQALLGKGSVRERLTHAIFHLCERRTRLSARLALEASGVGGGSVDLGEFGL